ncbi:multipolar spindle 1 [Striga asiatica]|uniref:Multipolar spindle 1 n=1 Tax=Striga asiatica TaxID=4170 RepID=A0A5A7Q315_STRAF|nr:multipolar spindle 1 [Striga asiatica]
MENLAKQHDGDLNPSLKLAVAMAIVESRRRRKIPPPSATTEAAGDGDSQAVRGTNSESDAIKWKTKSVSCKCYFFDNLGRLSPKHESEQKRFGDVLRRRFLRQVRLSERKRIRLDGAVGQSCISDSDIDNGMEQLRASVDFLVELCETSSPNGAAKGSLKNWSHQAVDFILATLNTLSSGGKKDDMVESIISSLIVRLMRRMCNGSQGDELVQDHCDFQFYVQHLLRKLGTDSYVGQRLILSVSQRISIVAESLLVMDPFDGAFPKMHNGMYLMIQLIEFLISDCLISWSTRQDFDTKLLEEWIVSVFSARKALELLETRNTLYALYMDRVVGALTRHLGQPSLKDKLRPNTLEKLFG